MEFKKSNGGKIKIHQKVLNKIEPYLQTQAHMPEAGGILLGRYIIDSEDIVIDDITEPSEKDIRQRLFYFRSRGFHQRTIIRKWTESQGTCNYLGEWHTHPESIPTPSLKDVDEWKKALKKFKVDYNYLYFLIAGTCDIQVWEGNKESLEINKLDKFGGI